MSNDIFGCLWPPLNAEGLRNLNDYTKFQKIGIAKIKKEELYNFPNELIPTSDCYSFLISDRPHYPNASYLIDYLDYAPEADIGFPVEGKARLNILLDVLSDIFSITNAQKMLVALTECSQIETIKKIKLCEIYDVIHKDFELYQGPPDTLYEITG